MKQILNSIRLYFICRQVKKQFGFYPLQVSSPVVPRMPLAPKGPLISK